MATIATVLFNGVAYGMLLFIMSVGLSVTMGMMNFVNLAHASFSMLGGYVLVVVTQQLGLPFLLAASPARVRCRRLSRRSSSAHDLCYFYGTDDLILGAAHARPDLHVDRVDHLFLGRHLSADQRSVRLATGQQDVLGLTLERYRMFLVAVGAVLALVELPRTAASPVP